MELAPLKSLNLPDVTFLVTGMGPRNAEQAIVSRLAQRRPAGIIHIGFAGALAPSLRLGDVVIADNLVGVRDATVDSRLLQAARNVKPAGAPVYIGAVYTADRIAVTAREKRALIGRYGQAGPLCVDMESAVVAAACVDSNVPYLGIRCITDTLEEDLPLDLNACRGSDGNVSTVRIVKANLSHPHILRGLLEMRRRSQRCAQILAQTVHTILEIIARPAI